MKELFCVQCLTVVARWSSQPRHNTVKVFLNPNERLEVDASAKIVMLAVSQSVELCLPKSSQIL